MNICPKCKGDIDNLKEMMPDWTTCCDICKRCINGTILPEGDGRKCVNCGQEYTKGGQIIIPKECPDIKRGAYRETWSGVSFPEERG